MTTQNTISNLQETFQKGLQLHQQGVFAEAETIYRDLLQEKPDSTELLKLLGILKLQLQEFDEAENLLQRALRNNPELADIHCNLGNVYSAKGLLPEAISAYSKTIELAPDMFQAYTNLGKIYHCQNKLKEAEAKHRQALEINPGFVDAQVNMVDCLKEQLAIDELIVFIESILESGSESAFFQLNLGLALNEKGEHDRAVLALEKSVKLDSSNDLAVKALAFTLVKLSRLEDALSFFKLLAQRNPQVSESHLNVAKIHDKLNEIQKSKECFEKAVEIDPENPEVYIDYSWLYSDRSYFNHALEVLLRAEKAIKGNSELSYNIGQVYQKLENFDKAEEYLEATLLLNPENREAKASIAEVLSKKGEFIKAYEAIEMFLQDSPPENCVVNVFAQISRHLNQDEKAVEQLLTQLERDDLKDAERSLSCFRLADLLDRQGEYDRAFPYYEQGNQLRDIQCDRERSVRHFNAVKNIHSVSGQASLPRVNSQEELPVFIVSMPRSGSTLVEQILSSHSEVFGAGELNDMPGIVDRIRMASGVNKEVSYSLDNMTSDLFSQYAEIYLARLREISSGEKRVTDKLPGNFMRLGLIELMFPAAKIIHVKRNPMDTCLSCYFQSFGAMHDYAYSLEDLGFYYTEYEKLMAHWRSVLKIPILEIEYRDLVLNSEEVVRKMLAFCGLEWEQQCLDFHKNKRAVATASFDQVRQKMYSKSVDRYKNYEAFLGPLKEALEIS